MSHPHLQSLETSIKKSTFVDSPVNKVSKKSKTIFFIKILFKKLLHPNIYVTRKHLFSIYEKINYLSVLVWLSKKDESSRDFGNFCGATKLDFHRDYSSGKMVSAGGRKSNRFHRKGI